MDKVQVIIEQAHECFTPEQLEHAANLEWPDACSWLVHQDHTFLPDAFIRLEVKYGRNEILPQFFPLVKTAHEVRFVRQS